MISPSNRLPRLRLWTARGHLFARLSWPARHTLLTDVSDELVLIASPTTPHLRRLTLLHRRSRPPVLSGGPPEAA